MSRKQRFCRWIGFFFFHLSSRCGEKCSVIYITKLKISVFSVIRDMVKSLLVSINYYSILLVISWCGLCSAETGIMKTCTLFYRSYWNRTCFHSALLYDPLLTFLVTSPVFCLTCMLHFIAIKIQDPIIFQCNWGYGVQSFN